MSPKTFSKCESQGQAVGPSLWLQLGPAQARSGAPSGPQWQVCWAQEWRGLCQGEGPGHGEGKGGRVSPSKTTVFSAAGQPVQRI